MAVRRWFLRSLILLLPAAVIVVGLWLIAWIDPEIVRQKLIQHLQEKWSNVDIEVGDARLRILGGISVTDLKLIRSDDPTRTPFLSIPSAILYHDKEQLRKGRLVFRKIELQSPTIQLARDLNGMWNLDGLLKADDSEDRTPCFTCRNALIRYTDYRKGAKPLIELSDLEIRFLNDPLPVYNLQARFGRTPIGPLTIQGVYDRQSRQWSGSVDTTALQISPALAPLLSYFAPEWAATLQTIQATGTAHLDVAYVAADPKPILVHDLRVNLKSGRFEHPSLPLPLEDLHFQARCRNGHFTLEKATARAGRASLTLELEMPESMVSGETSDLLLTSLTPSRLAQEDPLKALEARIKRLELVVQNLLLSPELFEQLPRPLRFIQDMFSPRGPVSLVYTYRREPSNWEKKVVIHPEGFTGVYQDFRYPLQNVRGTIEQTFRKNKPDHLKVDVTAEAAGCGVSIRGDLLGKSPEKDINLTIKSEGLPLSDPQLIAALPLPYPDLVKRLHPGGRADLMIRIQHNAQIRREYGPDQFNNEFTITMRDAQINYDEFPYQLERVNGTLYIRTQPPRPTQLPPTPGVPSPNWTAAPDVGLIELRNFVAFHKGSVIRFSGRKEPVNGGAVLGLTIQGDQLDLDEDLRVALSRLRMEGAWRTFSPRGVMNCVAKVRLFERGQAVTQTEGDFDPNQDLEFHFAFAGGTIQPKAFPYLLTDVAGRISFAQGRVELQDFTARHGGVEVKLPSAEVLFRPDGGYWADLQNLDVTPLITDADFIQALPSNVRSLFETLELKGPVHLHASRIVIDDPTSTRVPPYLPQPANRPNQLVRLPRSTTPKLPVQQAVFTQLPIDVSPPLMVVRSPITLISGITSDESTETLPEPTPVPQSLPIRSAVPVVYWDGRLDLLGASLKTGVTWENVRGSFASRGRYEKDHLGRVIANLVVDRATILKQPIQDFHARIEVQPDQPDIVQIPIIKAALHGGEIGGEARLVLRQPFRYDIKLNATRIRLDELAKQQKLDPKIHLEGLANAQLYLQNPVDDRTGRPIMQGAGSIDIPQGKMLRLPGILDLLKFLKLKVPDETMFEEAHALFRIRENRVMIGQLDLLGNAISLGGEGEMNLDGTDLNLQFYTVWSRINNLMAPAFSEVTSSISKAFFKVTVQGDLNRNPKIRKEPVPVIVEPIRQISERNRK